MTEYRIVALIDPAGATQGSNKVKQELRGVANEAKATQGAIVSAFDPSKFDRSLGSLIDRMDTLDKSIGSLAGNAEKVAQSNNTLIQSLDRIAVSGVKAADGAKKAGDSAKGAASGQASLEAATRRVLQAVDQEAAEMLKLNALLLDAKKAYEGGSITAQQYSRVQQMINDSGKENTKVTGAQKAGYQQLGFQLNDIVTSLQGGASPLTVFAQQASQLGQAIQLISGDGGGKGSAQDAQSSLSDLNETVAVGKELYGNAKDATGALGTALNKQATASKSATGSTAANTAATAENAVSHGAAATAANADAVALTRGAAAAAVDSTANIADAAATGVLTRAKLAMVAVMSGPWGAAVIAGVVVLGSLAQKLFESGESVDDLVDKLKEDAKSTDQSRDAKERFRLTQEGVAAAIREGIDATKKSIEATKTSAEQDNIAAKQALQREIQIRKTTLAMIDQARQQRDSFSLGIGGTSTAAVQQAAAAQRVVALNEEAGRQSDLIAKAEARVQQTRVDLAFDVADKQSTAVGRVTLAYDRQISALERTVRAQVQAGKTVDASLTNQIVSLKQRRQAAIDATNEQERLNKSAEKSGPLTQFASPVTGGRISSGFGPRAAPTAGASTFHKGIDIAAPVGTPVKAAAGGVVIYAGKLGGLGNAIIVDHGGGTITEYGHLSQVLTQKGARVGQGDQIGAVGSTGISTGPHLDYRVKTNGRYVDPRTGRFRTDETSIDVRAASAAEAAQRKAETAAAAKARKEEQERDFVSGVVDEAASRGQNGRQDTLQARIDKTLADFKRRFDREANGGERTRITDALTQADARETAARFDEAYVQPLKRLQALQGATGLDRQVLNTELEETAKLGRELSPIEKEQIENGIRQGDAIQRQASILESLRQPQQDYADRLAAINALLATGQITQTQYNAQVAQLGQGARDFKAGLPGNDTFGRSFADQAKKEQADAQQADELATLETGLNAGTILYSEAYGIREAIARKHSDTLREIDRARTTAAVGSAQSIADSLVSIAQDSVGKQSAVYKGLFVISKAFAIADAVIKIQQGIANALSLPFPANLAAAATVAAEAASIVSTIQAVKLNLASGGEVRGRGTGTSDSVPANLSRGEFVVNAAATSNNRALLEAINNGSVTANSRRVANDNAAIAASGGGAGAMTFSFGDINVNVPEGTSPNDGQAVGRAVREQLNTLIDDRLRAGQRPGGLLTKTKSSVMTG